MLTTTSRQTRHDPHHRMRVNLAAAAWVATLMISAYYVFSVLTTVSPSDDVYCQAQTNNSSTAYAGLVYWCEDETTQAVYSGTVSNPNYTEYPFEGNSVEWIVEKAYPNMADFGTTYMWGPYGAYTSSGDWFNYSQVNNIQLEITSNGLSTGTVLDTAYPPDPGSWDIDWSWSAYN